MIRVAVVLFVPAVVACDSSKRLSAFDDDDDGYYTETASLHGAEPPWDCDDEHAEAYPGGIEVCDQLDNDCNGVIDDAPDRISVYADADKDGYGDGSTGQLACGTSDGWVADNTDCNDHNSDRNPSGTEFCNEADDDCDGVTDEDGVDGVPWWLDSDGDGAGDESSATSACAAPEGYVSTGSVDCDDADAAIFPGNTEDCGDGKDNDCSGTAAGCEWPMPFTISDFDASIVGSSSDVRLGLAFDVGDVTADGVADVLALNEATRDVKVWSGGVLFSGGGPSTVIAAPSGSMISTAIAVGDVTDDAIADLVVAWVPDGYDMTPMRAEVHEGPIGGVPLTVGAPFGSAPECTIFVADLVGSNGNDILMSDVGVEAFPGPMSSASTWSPMYGPSNVQGIVGPARLGVVAGDVMWTDSGGSGIDFYTSPMTVSSAPEVQVTGVVVSSAEAVASGDIDGDGDADLLVADASGCQLQGCVYVFLADTLTFGANPIGIADFTISGTSTDKRLGAVRIVGDATGDGMQDIAIVTSADPVGRSDIWVMSGAALIGGADLGDPGTWRMELDGGPPSHDPYLVRGGDLNDDGLADLAVAMPDIGARGTIKVAFGISP